MQLGFIIPPSGKMHKDFFAKKQLFFAKIEKYSTKKGNKTLYYIT